MASASEIVFQNQKLVAGGRLNGISSHSIVPFALPRAEDGHLVERCMHTFLLPLPIPSPNSEGAHFRV